MRPLLAALLLVALVAGCSSGDRPETLSSTSRTPVAPAPKAPFLPTTPPPNSVARFPCKRTGTTIELESCSVRHVLVLNARINQLIKIIWARLGDVTGRRYFVTAERAWKVYVRNECISRSRSWIDPAFPHSHVGGTLAPVLYGACQEELTAAHLGELIETAETLARP